ncbi:glucosamine-6-phosphate deaminase [Chamaesiphon polymorphus]|uniref:Glucosamine-6-phosphate deaminase n=1 Tax=Chamaesiphon polymorphus CCALA 037 TaxID=2107692 RepID=A0A2T1FTG2_9CYAN|nr:glucosamine-6-phosphate deaminase [Chamaesiphon polymorphus]PSB48241.1 glucosamine-6-phosphate deaminase [Chamaesiphon polymorphus CCALA 037]
MPNPLRTFQVDALQVEVYRDEADIVSHLVQHTQSYLSATIDRQGSAAAILASGASQIKLLKDLTTFGEIDWGRLTLFHLDEYLGIGGTHPASFQLFMREMVAQKVALRQFHYLAGDTLEPIAECDRYDRLLSAQPIDLCFLGIGETGHIAFNDPEVADFNDRYPVKLVKLADKSRQQQVNTGFFDRIEAVPQYALTLTLPTICKARRICCLAMGTRKAAIVKTMLTGEIAPTCPATILRKYPAATLYLDEAAASEIMPLLVSN